MWSEKMTEDRFVACRNMIVEVGIEGRGGGRELKKSAR
jgi:hypothetical protein